MNIVVQKYGGTSVGTIDAIKNVAQRIIKKQNEGSHVVVVVSAMGKRTDYLTNLAYELTSQPPKREMDMLLSTGEQTSISLLSMALDQLNCPAISLTGVQVGIQTKGHHTKSRIKEVDISKILHHLKNNKVVIIAGFQGVNENDDITTLGRGGSDTSAVALACKLECPCEIYTDVDGIYSVDPRVYPNAKKIDEISYQEMLEMSSLGAGVMHGRAVELGQKFGIPIYVASSMNLNKGTIIKEGEDIMERTSITGLAIDNDDVMISLNHVPYDVKITASMFNQLAEKDINVDMISQTSPENNEISISFTVPKEDLENAHNLLKTFIKIYPQITISIEENITKLSVVGIGMRSQSGVAAKLFYLLAENDIEIQMVTTSEIRISCVIKPENYQKAVEIIAEAFEL
jgi:aspartate kinase